MINDEMIIQQVGKMFNFPDIKSYEELYAKGFSETDVKTMAGFIKNRIDPISWIKENVKIKHPAHGSIPFELYDFQEDTIKLFLKKHFIVTLKSRQVGMSTLVQAICLWCAMNYLNFNILILSAQQRQSTSFLSKIRYMYTNLPNNQFKLKLTVDNRQSIEFENGSKITAIPATRNSAIGESINLLIIDEAAFIRQIDGVYQGSYPTLARAFASMQGKPYGTIVISTPNGVSGTGKWYYEMYSQAVDGINGFTPIKIHWSLVPEYDDKWYLDQCEKSKWNYQVIAAEFELSFISSGNTYIPGPILDVIDYVKPLTKDAERNLWIWELPVENVVYVAGVDTAYGDRKDASVLQIIRADNLEQVLEFESNSIGIDNFADIIIKLTKQYNRALVNIERNTIGKTLIDKILDKTGGLDINLYRDIKPNDITVENKTIVDSWKSDIGTIVTGQSRDIILSNMYSIILENYNEGLFNILSEKDEAASARKQFEDIMTGKAHNTNKKIGIIKSQRLFYQLLKFVTDDHNRPEGDHDDLIFAWAHSLYCYTKSKSFLLKDIAKIVVRGTSNSESKCSASDTIEFMKRFSEKYNGSKLWDKVDTTEIEEYYSEINNKNEECAVRDNGLNNLYKSFYK